LSSPCSCYPVIDPIPKTKTKTTKRDGDAGWPDRYLAPKNQQNTKDQSGRRRGDMPISCWSTKKTKQNHKMSFGSPEKERIFARRSRPSWTGLSCLLYLFLLFLVSDLL
jgi:hypothetical protein